MCLLGQDWGPPFDLKHSKKYFDSSLGLGEKPKERSTKFIRDGLISNGIVTYLWKLEKRKNKC